MHDLWQHQREAIDKGLRNGNLAAFMVPGAGKTRIGLELIREWGLPAIVVAPAHAGHVWADNARKFLPDVRVRVLTHGPKVKRETEINAARGIVVVNYEAVWSLRSAIRGRSWKVAILDECQRCASPKARTTKTIQGYLGGVPHRIALTAWPTHKKIDHVFCPFRFVDGGEILGMRASEFRFTYMQPHPSGWGWIPQDGAERRLAAAIADTSFVLRDEDLAKLIDVPEIVHARLNTELEGATKAAYREAQSEWSAGGEDIQSASERALRMLQATSGLIRGGEEFDPKNPKTTALLGLLDDWGLDDRVIVYGWFRKEVDGVAEAIQATGRYACSVKGGDNVADALAEWRSTPGGVLVVQAGMATGWEATEGPYVVFHSRPFTATTYHQCIKRVARHGQARSVLVTDIVAERTVDEKLKLALEEEKEFVDLVRDLVMTYANSSKSDLGA